MTAASSRTQEEHLPLLLLLAAALLVSTIPSTSAQNSCTANCPSSSRPVCANNKKFSSECHARCAGYVAITAPVNSNCNTPSSSSPKTSQSGANQLNRNSNAGGGNAPCTCPRIYNPVCGVDGSFFPNPCLAKCVGVQVSDQKPKDGKCGYIVGLNGQNNNGAAVGAANGNTAPQQAGSGLGSTEATANPQGSMQGKTTSSRACNCPDTTDFVCGQPPGSGNMAVTYHNNCMAKCLGARILRQGPCSNLAQGSASRPVTPVAGQSNWQPQQQQQQGCNCPRSWQPVCSVTGETFGNACAAYCAEDDVAYEGECQGSSSGSSGSSSGGLVTGIPGLTVPLRCLRPCPRLYLPVCGSDGVTYPNLCTARCSGAPRIPLPRPGVCR